MLRVGWEVVLGLAAVGVVLLFVSASGSASHGVSEAGGVVGLLLVVPAVVRGWRHLAGRGGGWGGWGSGPGGPPHGGGGGH